MYELDDPDASRAFDQTAENYAWVCGYPGCYFMCDEMEQVDDECFCPVHMVIEKKERGYWRCPIKPKEVPAVRTESYMIRSTPDAQVLASWLVGCSMWFTFDPYPDEEYCFSFKEGEVCGHGLTTMLTLMKAVKV